jgi:hypothetical protein
MATGLEEMMYRTRTAGVILAALGLMLLGQVSDARAGKPTIAGGCKRCHKAEEGAIRGKLGNVSDEFKSLQVKVGTFIWVVTYDQNTTVIQGEKKDGAAELAKLKKGKEILVSTTGDPQKLVATAVSVKQPYKVPERQKITHEEVKALVAKGPEEGAYTLVDARPKGVFLSGHIPTALSLPFGAFEDKHGKVLPKDKDRHIIFYCGGPT